MAAAKLPVYDASGVLVGYLQTYRNTVGADSVDSEAITLTSADGQTQASIYPPDGSVFMADSGEREFTHVTGTVTASGDTILYPPTGSNKVRLRWISAISDPSSTTPPLIKVRLGANEYYRVYALAKRQRITGPAGGALIINLSGSGSVAVTAILEEVP